MPGNHISTVGAEWEGVIQSTEGISVVLPGAVAKYISSVTHDASVESQSAVYGRNSKIFLGSRVLRDLPIISQLSRVVNGFEIVTKPLSKEEMRIASAGIINTMEQTGEIHSDRSSTHFHVGYPRDYVFLKPALAMALAFEPLLFKIAGMGRTYRGAINNSAYARSLEAPPAVKTERSDQLLVLNPQKALEANNETEFWKCFGLYPGESPQRYHPARYFASNIYSILLRGTYEYRFFNACTHIPSVWAVASLCQALTDLTSKIPLREAFRLRTLSSLEENSDADYHRLFESILESMKRYSVDFSLDDRDAESIHKLIDSTPSPRLSRITTQTHLEKFRYEQSARDVLGLKTIDSAPTSGALTIHNFAEKETSLICAS